MTTKTERIGNVICWLLILWSLVWLCVFGIPGFVDRCSRHEAAWLDGGWRHAPTEMASEKLSEED